MVHPKQIRIEDYTYQLPEEKIAAFPKSDRDSSKLLVYKNGRISENIYRNIDEYLHSGSLLVFNNTKVVQARLFFKKETGAQIEVFCLESAEQKDTATAFSQTGKVLWKCLLGGASKWKDGKLSLKVNNISIEIENKGKEGAVFLIEFSWQPAHLSFAEILHVAGKMPLPPYIKRKAEILDECTYQTIYSKEEGSVAAPTAGLHFTETIFRKLDAKNIQKLFVTLHVGAGTFKPVKSEFIADHEMHAEWIDVSLETIDRIRLQNTSIVAVGTTSMRTLESLYWMGLKSFYNPDISFQELQIKQWEVYELEGSSISVNEALTALISYLEKRKLSSIIIPTQIIIAPGYNYKIAKTLITNFHQPNSTLLLLVAALIGEDWTKVYKYALENDFRFLSYGDGCLLTSS